MRWSRRPSNRLVAARLAALVLALLPAQAWSGKVVLKSGLVIEGIPARVPGMTNSVAAANQGQNVPQTPYWMVDDGVRRYFVHRQNLLPGLAGVDQSDDSSGYVTFQIDQLKRRMDAIPAQIGAFVDVAPFNEFGHGRVTLRTPRGEDPVQLAITRIDPRFLKVESTSHTWEFGLDPSTLPVELLRKMIHQTIDPRNPDERLAVVKYFLQMKQFAGARAELEEIRSDFPELQSRVEAAQKELFEQYGLLALREIVERRSVGQHELAKFLLREMLKQDLAAESLRDAQELLDDYNAADERMIKVRSLLSDLQAALPPADARRVAVIRSTIESELGYDTLPRLEPFLSLSEDPTLPAAEKLGLALSGWVLGPEEPKTQLTEAIALWDARFLLLEYLHPTTDRGDRFVVLEKLKLLEGISVAKVAKLIPLLPTPVEFAAPTEGQYPSFEAPPDLDHTTPVRYAVQLPPEYNPARAYPAIVTLRAEGRTPEDMLKLWGARTAAQRYGYIVIAPEYAPVDSGTYDYGRTAHDAVLRSLFDARRRFHIDSDRVFLTGHGMGGDAAYDLGLSHPDLWAGVIPFTGRFQHAAYLARTNAPHLPLYIVGGERDRNTLALNAGPMSTRMQRGDDVIYCEYKARGFENYFEELPRVFDWMSRYRRQKVVRDLKQVICRDFDNRYGWLKWLDLPPQFSQTIVWGADQKLPQTRTVTAKIATPQRILVTLQPGKHTVLWLSPEFVDYEQRLKITVNSGTPYNDFPTPDMATLLDDLRERGDRQMLYWTKLTF